MKLPRSPIALLMVAVAMAALDFAAIRTAYGLGLTSLLPGALPMANVVAVGLLIAKHHPASRVFLVGFEICGLVALALYVVFATFAPDLKASLSSYVGLLILQIGSLPGQKQPFVVLPTAWAVAMVSLGWPQMAFAVLGGYLSCRLRVTDPDH